MQIEGIPLELDRRFPLNNQSSISENHTDSSITPLVICTGVLLLIIAYQFIYNEIKISEKKKAERI